MQKVGGGGTPTLLRSWEQAAPTAASAPASLSSFCCCCWREGLSVCSDCFQSAFRYEYNDMRRWGWWRTSCGEEKKRDWYDAAVTMKTPLYERADIFRRIHGHISIFNEHTHSSTRPAELGHRGMRLESGLRSRRIPSDCSSDSDSGLEISTPTPVPTPPNKNNSILKIPI